MPISTMWGNPQKTILLEVFEGQWTVEEYQQLVDEAAAYSKSVPHTVHVIVDGSRSALPPTQMFRGMQYALKHVPPNQGMVIYVKISRVARMFVEVAQQISPQLARSTFFADTIEEAYRLVARLDASREAGV